MPDPTSTQPTSLSFTTRSNGLLRVLCNDCGVCAPFDIQAPPVNLSVQKFRAIWDTGATNSVISQAVVDALSLAPIGITEVRGVHGMKLCEAYLVNIGLPNKIMIPGLTVTKGELAGGDLLIGMDIIVMGDFSVTNHKGVSQFSFRVPSAWHLDYVAFDSVSMQRQKVAQRALTSQSKFARPKHQKRKGKGKR